MKKKAGKDGKNLPAPMICRRTWLLGDPIHSTGVGAIEKKMVQSFAYAFATARVEGVFMGRGSVQEEKKPLSFIQQP
jgi:hypothetical protein